MDTAVSTIKRELDVSAETPRDDISADISRESVVDASTARNEGGDHGLHGYPRRRLR